jgi:hypothetical protein
MRSKTSHSYAEEIAIEVVERIPAFLDEATFCLTNSCSEISHEYHYFV